MLEGALAALDAVEKATGERAGQLHRLLPRRHAARGDARLPGSEEADNRVRQRARSSSACSTSRSPASSGVFIDEAQVDEPRAQDERARLPRGLRDGGQPSTCCARTTWSGRSWSTTTCWARTRFRSTCCTGTRTRRACRRACTASTCATCTSRTCSASRAASRSPACRSTSRRSTHPAYFISTVGGPHRAVEDDLHRASQLPRRPRCASVLGGSGHIAGIVNPPAAKQVPATGRTTRSLPAPDEWLKGAASQIPGSGGTTGTAWIEQA